MERISRTEQDRIDLGHELSGNNVGRIQRFSVAETLDQYGENPKEKRTRQIMSMLAYLLAEDAQYARLYRDTEESLNRAQRAVDQAMSAIDQRLEDSANTLQDLRDGAVQLDDGTRVFLSENGNVFTEHGSHVRISTETFGDDNPSWEDFKIVKDEHETLLAQREQIETYQRDVLDDAQQRMSNEDDPLLKEELEALKERIDDGLSRLPIENPDAAIEIESAASIESEHNHRSISHALPNISM